MPIVGCSGWSAKITMVLGGDASGNGDGCGCGYVGGGGGDDCSGGGGSCFVSHRIKVLKA